MRAPMALRLVHALFCGENNGGDVIPDGIRCCWWRDSIKMLPRWGTRIEAAIRLASPVRYRFTSITAEAERCWRLAIPVRYRFTNTMTAEAERCWRLISMSAALLFVKKGAL